MLDWGVADTITTGYDKAAASYLNGVIRGAIKDKRITMHSTRHTFADRARKDWAMPQNVIDAWGGWVGAGKGISEQVYGGRLGAGDLAEHRSRVHYPALETGNTVRLVA